MNIVGGESDNLLFGKGEFKLTVEQEEKFIENMNTSETSVLLVGKVENKIASVASLSSAKNKKESCNEFERKYNNCQYN